ncbi:MAG: PP2C family protein-serine/threonine phosphatase [Solobacterium sp.]|nr:PP2C family protein-serine/threonine phosphatase [Solobacterium sp.]
MRKKKTISLSRYAVYMIIGQAVILTVASLIVSFIFFTRSATVIYEEMDRSITGAALAVADKDVMSELARETLAIYNSMDDPVTEFETNKDAYLERYQSIMNSPEYHETRDSINRLRKETASSAICYKVLIPGENIGIYVFDASDANVLPCGAIEHIDTSYLSSPTDKFKSYIFNSQVYGRVRTDGVPCCTNPSEGIYSYLTADIPISAVSEKSHYFLLNTGILALIITTLICAGASYILRQDIVKVLERITSTAKHFAETRRNTNANTSTDIFQNLPNGEITEFNDLVDSLQQMEIDMNEYVVNLRKMTEDRTRIKSELELAESIQSNMLPSIFPAFPERSEFDIYALMDPAREVGGDFYDFFLIDNDHLAMVIADVSGKGIPAALFMMMSKILVKNYVTTGSSPAEALAAVNNTICQNNTNDMFVTIWLGILTISTGKIIAANAGHEYPILQRAGGQFEVIKDKHGFVVGSMPNLKYSEYEIDFHTGDTLFVYTDGLPESTNSANEQFGLDRILEVLNNEPDGEVEDLFVSMGVAVAEFVQDAEQFDDLTMLALKGKDIPKKES